MGTVHSFEVASTSPDRLRRRFDRAFPEQKQDEVGLQPLPEVLVAGGIFFLPFSLAGQLVDNAFRDASLFWLSLSREQLRFFCLIP